MAFIQVRAAWKHEYLDLLLEGVYDSYSKTAEGVSWTMGIREPIDSPFKPAAVFPSGIHLAYVSRPRILVVNHVLYYY